jgi:hypothetical protein
LGAGQSGFVSGVGASRSTSSRPGRGIVLAGGRSWLPVGPSPPGLLYQNGFGVDRDSGHAFKLYLRAAHENDAIAERLFALPFADRIGTTPHQTEEIAWLKRPSQHGDADSMYLL